MNPYERHPNISILHQVQGACRAGGVAVIIDVLRASSMVCYLAAAGAVRIWAVADEVSAMAMARSHGPVVLIGERHGRRLPGFAWGNSPSLLHAMALTGQTVVLTTSNGTQGLAAARSAEEIVTAGFVNARAVVAYIHERAAAHVSLVCMGSGGRPALEDTLCALYLKAALEGRPLAFEPLRQAAGRSSGAAIFKRGVCADLPPDDLERCLDLDRFDFVLRVAQRKDDAVLLAPVTDPAPASGRLQ